MSDAEDFVHFLNSLNPSHHHQNTAYEAQIQPSNTYPTHLRYPPCQSASTPTLSATPATSTPTRLPTHTPPSVLSPPIGQSAVVTTANTHDSKELHAYINVDVPPKTVKTQQRKTKVSKDTLVLGPVPIPSDVSHAQLVEIVAETLQCTPQDVDTNSMCWKLQKPLNSKYLPLRDDAGIIGMFSLALSKPKQDPKIFIDLKVNPPQPSKPVLPWKSSNQSAGSSNLGRTVFPGSTRTLDEILGYNGGGDYEDEDVDKELKPSATKGIFSEDLADIKEQLYDIYPVGNCSDHPRLRCYLHKETGNHFDIDIARVTSWASKIRKNEPGIGLFTPPIGCNLWRPQNAMKKKATLTVPTAPTLPPPHATLGPNQTTSSTPTPGPSTSSTAFPPTGFPAGGYMPPFMPFMPPMPTFMNPFMMPFTTPSPELWAGTKRTANARSSSPVLLDEVMSVEDFCVQYRLGQETVRRLKEMDFSPGDKLSAISKEEYTSAGFTTLSWQRVMAANRQYMKLMDTRQ